MFSSVRRCSSVAESFDGSHFWWKCMQELAQDFQISSWTSIWVSGNFSILAVVGCLQLVQAAVVSQGAFLDHSLEKSLGLLAMGHGCWVGMFQPMESPKMCWWCKSYIIPFQAIDTFMWYLVSGLYFCSCLAIPNLDLNPFYRLPF